MNVSEDQINELMKLQSVDVNLNGLRKKFEELPQREKIVEAREKRVALTQKFKQVEKILANAEKKVADIIREDDKLEQRQAEIQKDIDNAGSDYRNMEARSKELAGASRRRDELVGILETAESDKSKVESVKEQLIEAIKTLDKIEQTQIASFKKEGGMLKAQIAKEEEKRDKLASNVDEDLLKQYEKISASSGIAIGMLNGQRCGVCRTPLDDVRLLDVKRQAPLAICPYCKRLLAVV